MSKNFAEHLGWEIGVDFPDWGNTEEYVKTISRGYLINNEKPENHQTKKYLEDFSRTNGFCGYLQCSAKENKNVEEVFQNLLGTFRST